MPDLHEPPGAGGEGCARGAMARRWRRARVVLEVRLDLCDLLVVAVVAPELRRRPARVALVKALICTEHVVGVKVERPVNWHHVLELDGRRRLVVALHVNGLAVADVDEDGALG